MPSPPPLSPHQQEMPPICSLGVGPDDRHWDGTCDGLTPEQILTVSGIHVPICQLALPKGLRGAAREQVARRQLADRTGLSADALALRPFLPQPARTSSSDRLSSNLSGSRDLWNRVLVGDTLWLRKLQGLTCRAVLPDYLTLPAAEGIWTLALETADPQEDQSQDHSRGQPQRPACLLARLGPEDAFSAQPAIALAMLDRAITQEPPRAILWLGATSGVGPSQEVTEETAQIASQIKNLAIRHDIPLITTPPAATKLGLATPQVLAHSELACDLRHNPLAARAQLARKILPWRWPVLAACLAAGFWAAEHLVALTQIEEDLRASQARSAALVKTHFVPDGPVLDARLQVSRALSDLRRAAATPGQETDPLALMAEVAEVLHQAGLRPELLSYQAGTGLLLALRLESFAQRDQLAGDLRARALAVSLRDSRVSEGQAGVRAEFVITPKTPAPEEQR